MADIEPPTELSASLSINERLLMIPGPTNMHPRVQRALSLPIVSHMDPQFFQVMRDISAGIRFVFQTRNHYSLAITGSATCAMEAAICNLLERGDTLMVLVHGLWGQRAGIIGRKHGFNVVEVGVAQWGDVLSLAEIQNAIETHKPRLIYVCHGDSSVGTLQPLEGIGQVCHQNGCLLLVDAVVSLCCAPLQTDRLEIDCVFSGAQKALSGPPGVSLITLSAKAIQRIKSRKSDVDSYYMDINWLAKAWGLEADQQFIYHYTPALSLMYGLREALALVAEEGLNSLIERHQTNSAFVQNQISAMGLTLLVPKAEHRLPAILSVSVPDGIDCNRVNRHLTEVHNISIAGGLGPTAGRIWRLGLLGVNANTQAVTSLCRAFKEAIDEQKNELDGSKL